MKKLLLIVSMLFALGSQSQVMNVNTTTYTVPQLVTDVLFGSGVGGGACAGTISNITWSTGTNFGGPNGIGYFTNTNPNFPLNSGVVLVSGSVVDVPGPNDTTQSNGNWPGDNQLFNYIDGLGIDAGLNSYNNASILEFDFVPLTNQMSFDFMFASEEYGFYQCTFSDAFAFFLTDVTAGTPFTNLALIPNTTTPVSVVTIRNTLYNGGCPSVNPAFFDKYYLLPEGLNPNLAPINFNGHTTKMTASSAVIPNHVYHIKLVVADRNDSALDSAVFLGGGSFNIGQANVTGAAGTGFEALTDFTIANGAALCFQSCRDIRAGNAPIPGVSYQWTLNGVNIPGATSYNYSVCAPGTYGIIITFPSGCQQLDDMIIEYLPAMPLSNPVDLYSSSGIFNLTSNNSNILNGQVATDYIINYHLTLLDAQNVANIIPNPASYVGTNGQVIYVSIQDDASGSDCKEIRSFVLYTSSAQTPPNLVLCDDASNDGVAIFNMTGQTPIVLGPSLPTDYVITYHTSQADADNDVSPIPNINAYSNTSNPQTIYVRKEDVLNPASYAVVTFQLIVNQAPIAGVDGATTVCETSTTAINLSSLITGEQSGGTWVRSTGTGGTFNAAAGTFTPAVGATTSTFTYTVTGIAPCGSDSSLATVNINPQPTAGLDGATTVCETDPTVIDLYSLITGEQAGGTWVQTTGTGGTFNAAAGTYTPAVGATTSTFTYTVSGSAPCGNDSSVATVNINPFPTAGVDGATTVCETSTTVINLSSLITGEQPGGTWVQTTGTGGTFNAAAGTFTPAVGATTSTFTYTVTGIAPCGSDSSLATVNINPQPTAGLDGATTVCETDPTVIDLYSLITGEQAGGTWVQTTGTGGTFNAAAGTYTPAIGAITSTFTYTVSGSAPCGNDSSVATVNINPFPTAGVDGATTVCETSTTVINLSSLITGEQPGGTWVRSTGTGGTFNAVAGTFTPALGATTSTFTYTVTGIAPCGSDSSIATVNILAQPDAGSNGATTVCETDATIIDLYSLITGEQPGGTWARSTGTGGTFNAAAGTYTPALGATTSTFTYTITAIAPCTNVSSVATVNINTQPNAGTNGSTTVCETSTTAINLSSLITGEQSGGTWVRSTGTGGTFNAATGTFTPAVGATTSTFTYTLTATAPCTNASSVATVIINAQPDAGTNGTTTICETSTATIDLFGLITGEQAGGTWTRSSGTGGTFNAVAGIYTPAVGATTSTFTYTLTGTSPCINDASLATININAQPTAGADGSTTICENSTAVINLFSLITGEQAGGTWVRSSGTGGAFNSVAGTFTPAIGVTTSSFTYTLLGAIPCIDDSSIATITVNPIPTATITLSTPSVCMNYTSPTVTFTGASGASPYTFTYTINAGIPNITPPSSPTHVINVPTNVVGPFTYELVSVTDANGCSQNINQSVTVTVLTAPIINTPIAYELCDDDSNDGVACFDLATVVAPQVTTNPTLLVTFHETLTDSQTGAYAQATPYCNINNLNNPIIYIRVFDPSAPQCYALTTVQLIVHPKPIAVDPTPLHECDNGDAQVGFTVFNLTDKATEILGSINPLTHSISYYELLPDAQVPQNAIVNPTSFTNTVAGTQTIYVRVETTATGCFDIVELKLIVDPLPIVSQPACTAYTVCETTAPIGIEQFNLQTKVDCILGSQLGMSVTFYPSLLNAQNNTNAITNLLYTNTQPFVQTLGIRVTDNATGCYVISTMDIRVDPLPVPIAPLTPYSVCDTDQNGYYLFDLTTLSAGILGANPSGNVISYHETQTDAQTGLNAINVALPYTNTIAYLQTLWVRVENPLTGCYGIMPIQLKVNESPRMPNLDDLTYCDEDTNNQNATTTVNLAQQTAIILAAQTILPTSNYTVTYYTSLLDAQQQINNIINTATFTGTNQTIWVVVEHNITGCSTIGEFDLIVNIPLALTPPPALSVCDDDANPNNTFTTFDLTIRENAITTGLPGYSVTWYPSYANALAGTNAIANPSAYVNTQAAVQTLGVKVTSPQGCRSYTTMDIRVLPIPTPRDSNIPVLAPQCEDAIGSGQQFFNLTVNQTYILNNDPNVTAHYFHSLADAQSGTNEILTPTLAYIGDPAIAGQVPRPVNYVQTIYIAVTSNLFTDYTGQDCYKIVEQTFIINPLPIVDNIGEQQICEEDPTGNDGIEVFDLTAYTTNLIDSNNTTPASTYTVTFYTDAAHSNVISNPSAFTNQTNPDTIYVTVSSTNTYVDPATGTSHTTSCTSQNQFDIRVNPKPTIAQPANPLATCDTGDSQNDGYDSNYSLASLETEILNGQNPAQFTVTFYDSQYDPNSGLNPTPLNPATHQVYTHMYWAAVTNNATGCYKTTSFNIVVEQTPEPFITNDPTLNLICVDYITNQVVRSLLLESTNTTNYLNAPTTPVPSYTYQWYEDGVAIPGATSSTYLIDTPLNDNVSSLFTLEMTSQSALGCSDISQSFEVLQSGQAVPETGTIGYTITNAFTDNQIITVTVTGYGSYQYSLDDGPRQDSPVFEYVSLGEHIITVWDTKGGIENSCDPLIIENVQTIDYPHYFTPNGDGVHEHWNIVGLAGQADAKIYIFDRHGKLIKQISSQGEGWDGTYNGQQMPSTDYWFTVDYTEQNAVKQFRAHFSLKR